MSDLPGQSPERILRRKVDPQDVSSYDWKRVYSKAFGNRYSNMTRKFCKPEIRDDGGERAPRMETRHVPRVLDADDNRSFIGVRRREIENGNHEVQRDQPEVAKPDAKSPHLTRSQLERIYTLPSPLVRKILPVVKEMPEKSSGLDKQDHLDDGDNNNRTRKWTLKTVRTEHAESKLQSQNDFRLPPPPDRLASTSPNMPEDASGNQKAMNEEQLKDASANATSSRNRYLNDDTINAYLGLIARRSEAETELPSVYAFTTFFYSKYLKERYSEKLQRWTKNVDIFSFDLIFFPIHGKNAEHWYLVVVNTRNKTIKYYDSLSEKVYIKCTKRIFDYLCEEHSARKNVHLVETEWTLKTVADTPQQRNGYDCGVFLCKFVDFISRNKDVRKIASASTSAFRAEILTAVANHSI